MANAVTVMFRIRGISPLIQGKPCLGCGRKTPRVRNPEGEAEAATYRTDDGKYGIPITAIRGALMSAVRQGVSIRCDDAHGVIPMDCEKPGIHEDKLC